MNAIERLRAQVPKLGEPGQRPREDALADLATVDALYQVLRAWMSQFYDSTAKSKALNSLDELVGLVGTLQQRLTDAEVLISEEWPAQLDAMADRAEAAEDALATTRQALTEIASLPDQSEDWHEGDVAVTIARRALADTGGDTKEPA